MIGVSAATGHLGRATLQALSKRAPKDRLVAIVRDEGKAQDLKEMGYIIRHGDYDDPESMRKALFNVEKFLLISSNAIGRRTQQHHHAVSAAADAGVSLLAYTSILHCDVAQNMLAQEHRATEQAIRASKMPFVILRNGWYLENHLQQLDAVVRTQILMGAALHGQISGAARADYAAAAAIVLTEPGHMNKIYELAGDSGFSYDALAKAIAQASGKPINYRYLPPAAYAQALRKHHVPDAMADVLADSDAAIDRGELHDDSHKLSQLLGRPTRSLESLLIEILARPPASAALPHAAPQP